MAEFLSEHQEKSNEDGTLAFTGAFWTETRIGVVVLAAFFALTGLLVLGFGCVMRGSGRDPGGWVMLWSVFGACYAFFIAWHVDSEWSRKFRSVHFHANGDITVPNGLPPFYFWRRRIGGSHANIASIESMQTKEGYDVVIISTGGDTILLSEGLAQWQALKASVMLTNALQRMRQSKARLPVGKPAPRKGSDLVID